MVYRRGRPLDGGRVPLVVKSELSLEGGRKVYILRLGLWCSTWEPQSPVEASRIQNLQFLPTVSGSWPHLVALVAKPSIKEVLRFVASSQIAESP